MGPNGPKITIFGKKSKFAVYGPNILNFKGVGKNFGTQITGKNTKATCSNCFFCRAWDKIGQQCPFLAKNASFGPNLAGFGSKIHYIWVWTKTFGILISENQ